MSHPEPTHHPEPGSDSAERADEEHIGESVQRTDAPPKVRGEATYAMDLNPDSLLHAKLVTSQVPHATLANVDTSAAEEMDGVAAVATADDAPDTRRGAYIYDQPILADGKVRYVGEPIAVVAAETEEIAEQAAATVEVEYDELPAVFDLEASFERDPPTVIHEDVREYEFAGQGDPRYGGRGHISGEDADRPNLLYKNAHETGDVEAGFEEADLVIEDEYEVTPFHHGSMEPRIVIAHDRYDGITIRSSHQVPHNVHKKLCMAFPDIEPSDIRIETPFVGGGFGSKITDYLEAISLVIARKVNRPVRLALTRAEEYTVGINRPQVKTRIKDGVTDDGDLLARDVEILLNIGAYNEQVYRISLAGPSQVYAAYDIPNVRWGSYAVYTNRPKYGAFRGFGKPEVNWAMERHMDRVAEELGIDPLEYRAQNLLREGDTNATGETLGPNDTEGCLREPVERIRDVDLETEFPDYAGDEWEIGRGFAYGSKPIARAASAVTIKVRNGMKIEVHIGSSDIGQGSDTAFTQIAASAFGVDTDRIKLVTGDTDRTPYNRGPTGSRFTYHTGNAIRQAATQVKGRMAAIAADVLDVRIDPEALEIDGDRVYDRTDPDRSFDVGELFSDYDQERGTSATMLKDGGELIGTATYDARDEDDSDHVCWTPIGQAALVAVNRITGQTDVLRFVTACDVGRAINPENVEQQLQGGASQGIASALYEEIIYDDGHTVNPNYKDYRIPGSTELPYDNETIIIESMDDEGPYGAKGVGEMAVVPAAPALGNAIADAVDFDPDTIPMTPERVLPALED